MKTIPLENWKFCLQNKDAWAPGYDDSGWENVVVPHDWAVTFPFSRKHSSGTGYLPGGTGWYRCSFQTDDKTKTQAFLSFDGIYKNSQVWCNGYYLGERPNGYIGFRYDISHCLRQDRENIIAVKVTHEDIGDSRWFTGSGIYRKASVELCNPLYIKSESIIVKSTIQEKDANITVSGEVINSHNFDLDEGKITLIARGGEGELYEIQGRVSGLKANGSQNAGDSAVDGILFSLDLRIPNAKLWNHEQPNLYSLSLEISAASNGITHSYKTPPIKYGIRSFHFDPDTGFFINGQNIKLKGVCVHHDAGCLGAAVFPAVWRRRLEKLKKAGCNAIRASHNPHMNELYDLCDEMGFYVMEEAFDEWEGCKNKWTTGHNVYPPVHQGYYRDFPQWHERDLADMVIRGRNHPSIIMWSIGNEIDYPNDPYVHPLFLEMTGNNDANKPQQEREYNPDKPNMERLSEIAANLVKIVKKHDTERPVLLAAAFPELSSRIGLFNSLDMVGYNYKEHCYEEDHKRFPNLPFIGSENGHHYAAWKAVRDNAYISGQFLWTGIDYLGEARGWPIRGSSAGILDLAGNEKIAYYRRSAFWNDEPFIFMATVAVEAEGEQRGRFDPKESRAWELSRSWNYIPGKEMKVVCYTNLDSAELFLNGKSLGTQKNDKSIDHISWTLPFERGKLEVRGTGGLSDSLESVLPAVQMKLSLWKSEFTAGQNANIDGSEYKLSQVELELLDEEGRLCTRENPTITFSLTGEGSILGIENGNIRDLTEYFASYRQPFQGKLIVFIRSKKTAKIILEARGEGLSPAKLEI